MLSLPSEYRYRWVWDLPSDPEDLWPLVSDTDRFNRDTGLPPAENIGAEGEALENARRRLRIRLHGIRVEWEELPFEWVRPWRFGVVRRYPRGPMAEMRVQAELEPLDSGGTRLVYAVTAVPRGVLGHVAIPLQIGVLSRRSFGRVFEEYGRAAATADKAPAAPDPGAAGAARRVEALLPAVAAEGGDPDAAQALAGHVSRADAATLARIRPYVLADVWGLPRRDVLCTCLAATRAGMLELRWQLLCPLCRGVGHEETSLEGLRRGGYHCDSCRIDFGADFDRSVELVFRPSPAVRDAAPNRFCVAGPQVTPHVAVQQLLAPGERRTTRPRLEPGAYRLRTLSGKAASSAVRVHAEGEPVPVRATLGPEGLSAHPGDTGPEPELVLENATDGEVLLLVERTEWGDDAVTAAEVTALQEFRDLFSSEVLAAGEFMSVGTLTVLFTDLRGSTCLYREIGDPAAYRKVMEHFDVLRRAIVEEEGAVVKTIGDAVMAVFRDAGRAVRAVARAQRGLRAAAAGEAALALKAGVHTGPCIAVTLDGRLDYFGSTVNVASRLGGLADGDELVLSERSREQPGVAGALQELGAREAPFEARLRGVDDGPMAGWRVRFDGVGADGADGA